MSPTEAADRYPAFVFASCLFLLAVLDVGARVAASPGMDYFSVRAAARAVETGAVRDIYSPEGRAEIARGLVPLARADRPSREKDAARIVLDSYQGGFEDHATPLLHALIGIPSTPDYETDYRRFVLFVQAASVVSLLLLARWTGASWPTALVVTGLLLWALDPIRSDVRVANNNQLQLASLVAGVAVLARSRGTVGFVLAGAVFGLSVTAKPNTALAPALIALDLLLQRRVRETFSFAGGLVATGACAAAGAALYLGSIGSWPNWAAMAARSVVGPPWPTRSGNYGLVAVLREALGVDASLPLLVVLLASIVAASWRSRAVTGPNGGTPPLSLTRLAFLAGAGCAIPLLSSGYVWLHYYVLALPLVFVSMAWAGTLPERAVAAAAFVTLFVPGPLRNLLPGSLPAEAVLLNAAVVAFLVLGLRRFGDAEPKASARGAGEPNPVA